MTRRDHLHSGQFPPAYGVKGQESDQPEKTCFVTGYMQPQVDPEAPKGVPQFLPVIPGVEKPWSADGELDGQ